MAGLIVTEYFLEYGGTSDDSTFVPRESVKLGGKEQDVANRVSNEVDGQERCKHQHLHHHQRSLRSQTAPKDSSQNIKNAIRFVVVCISSSESFSFYLFALVGLVRPSRPLVVTIMGLWICNNCISEWTVPGGEC